MDWWGDAYTYGGMLGKIGIYSDMGKQYTVTVENVCLSAMCNQHASEDSFGVDLCTKNMTSPLFVKKQEVCSDNHS